MKQVIVRPAAAADIEDAYQWYELQRPGLGEEFLGALGVTRDRLLEQQKPFLSCTGTPAARSSPSDSRTASSTESTVTPS